MPLFYQHNINEHTRYGIWHITETEDFFLQKVPLKQSIGHPNKRLQHLAGRYLLHLLFPDFPYHLIEIADTRKPFLPNEEYHFSISHCGHYAAAIVSTQNRVGIDIEVPTPKVDKIKHKFLSEYEMGFVNNYPKTDLFQILTLLWSAKEAVFKWAANEAVDFIDHIHLTPAPISPQEGTISCQYLKGDLIQLNLHYKIFEQTVMVYVETTPKM